MIIKPYVARHETDPRLKAGVGAEKQMAHYLDRHFAARERFLVLHDLRFEFEGEIAQIDHLVVHPYGVAIIESKSVSTAVRLNAVGEWERRRNGSWAGMPDPLLQAERQARLLRRLLSSREEELLDKFLLGTLQGTFGFMATDVFAAISDEGRIERAHKGQAPNAKKADAIPRAVEDIVDQHRRDNRLLSVNVAAFFKAPRDFNKEECSRVARFLFARHRVLNGTAAVPDRAIETVAPHTAAGARQVRSTAAPSRTVVAMCKACGGSDLEGLIGKYGPYAKCRSCKANTSIREACEACGTKIYLTRQGTGFAGACDTCKRAVVVEVG